MAVPKICGKEAGGIQIPAIGLGTWQCTDESELETALNQALLNGYRHIDTAYSYQNEAVIGKVLRQWLTSGKIKREELFITTKLPIIAVHPDRVEPFIKKSLENLQLQYVDLYLIHFPIGTKYVEGDHKPLVVDGVVQTEPTNHIAIWKKMEEQIIAGRTKFIGISNFNIKQTEKIIKTASIKPACLQVELHVYLQQRELVKYCHDHDIVVVAYSPLGSPGYNQFIAKNFGGQPKMLPDMLNDATIKKIANKHNKTNAQVMLRYLIQKDVVAIPKSVKPARLRENINIFDFQLEEDDIKALDNLDVGEEARICDLRHLKGMKEHPEWPFQR